MLEIAFYNQNQLYECFKNIYITNNSLSFYLSYPEKDFIPIIYNNDTEYLQFVSKNNEGEVIGFMSGWINRDYELLQNLEVINFTGKPNIIFSKDIEKYLDQVFLYKKLRKIEFTCIANNPALKCYRKLIKKLNGREVGKLIAARKLTDGNYYDNYIFEIFREEYLISMHK